jgi:glycosyltransferase involved in cell wall biosynthesis
LRLVVTVERYAPAIGGAERVAQRVSEGLAARGHEVHVITGATPGPDALNGVRVHRLPITGNDVRGIQGDGGAVVERIDRLQPDLVFNYAAQTWATDCCRALLERDARPCMILAPCGFSGLHKRRYASYFAAMPARLRRYDGLILHSTVYQDWDFAVRAGVERMFVVPNGADPPTSGDGLRAQISSGSLAVTVGSHVPTKGHRDFARATRSLGRLRPLTGVIVAPERHGLDALRGCQLACCMRARMRGDDLRVLDGTAPGVVTDAVAAADLFLFTSRVECAPLVILEAMAAGTPWVSYDVGNVSELPGGLVASGFAELLRAAGQILDGAHPDLGKQGRAAWETSHRWEGIVALYESVFEEMLRAAPTPLASGQ